MFCVIPCYDELYVFANSRIKGMFLTFVNIDKYMHKNDKIKKNRNKKYINVLFPGDFIGITAGESITYLTD